ncbi:putative uncharacterized protein [Blautia hydrogenotrophica CAG:147]|nr:putative uncharacterized protein [Blautia hydrogenotrophica CAG:147]CUN19975.1 Uncharacterised protein [Blautia hydrogenotrophica]SCI41891.1 Uncharacterised protein [uncultured Blautia sp.]
MENLGSSVGLLRNKGSHGIFLELKQACPLCCVIGKTLSR